jgi:deazaflavin-dependent oxidoreductase (nitroreductase family)
MKKQPAKKPVTTPTKTAKLKSKPSPKPAATKSKKSAPKLKSSSQPVTPNQIFDSPTSWVKTHIQSYVKSNGKQGHQWRGLPTLLLTTKGRKTGKLRRTALIYGQNGPNYLLVASDGGAPAHPAWYLNLVDNPQVQLQVGEAKLTARARTATPKEKPRLWQLMTKIYPTYDKYQTKTDREIPVVVLEPI